MATLKYIIVKDEGFEHAIIFPEMLTHRQVAGVHNASCGPHLVAAGFCNIRQNEDTGDIEVSRWGKSESIPKDGRDEDKAILEKSLNYHY